MSKKKKVVTNKPKRSTAKASPTVSRKKSSASATARKSQPLIFDKSNYMLMLAGIALIGLGLILMMGGSMPSPDVWDEDLIYGTRRIVIAPLVILMGLGLEIYAIFKKSDTTVSPAEATV